MEDNKLLDKIEKKIIQILKKEGGAAGLAPLKKATDKMDQPKDFDLKKTLKKMDKVEKHKESDYILTPINEKDDAAMKKSALGMAMYGKKAKMKESNLREMNRETKTFIQEVGQGEGNRNVVTETQDTIINVITNTKVIGYERWKIQIALTPNEEYRVYIGLQYPLEEYNKLRELVEKEMAAELNSIVNNSETAFESLEEKI